MTASTGRETESPFDGGHAMSRVLIRDTDPERLRTTIAHLLASAREWA